MWGRESIKELGSFTVVLTKEPVDHRHTCSILSLVLVKTVL